ncbi:putative Low-affinity glucose transporter [Rhypophila sp. PSN 637]
MVLGKKSVRINGADCGIEALFLGAISSMGGFLFGYDTGQISGMLLFSDFKNRFGQNDDGKGSKEFVPIIQSLLVSLMSIGTLLGALSSSYTSDLWGRRKNLSWGCFIFVIGSVIQIAAVDSWVHMMMGRFVAGLGIGILSVGVPMFQSECSPREIRGAVVATYQLMITFGILISNIVNFGVRAFEDNPSSWRLVIGLGIVFASPLGLGVFLLPESPRWLAGRQDWDGARMSMARLRGMKHDHRHQLVEDDMKEMRTVLEKERLAAAGTWKECFIPKKNGVPKQVYRTILGVALQFLQQWTGVNYFFYYGATIFESAGIDDPIRTQLILGTINVAMTFFGLYVVERFGRRMPLFIGAIWQAAWLAVFAAMGTAVNPKENSASGIVMIVAAAMFIASFAATWGPIIWVVIGETFPLRTRAKQASLATAANWLGNFMLSFLTPLATDKISYAYGFVFVGTNIVAAIVVYFFLYESVSLSLENVDYMYSLPDLKPWTSSKWIPEGYQTRMKRDDAHFARRAAEDDERTQVASGRPSRAVDDEKLAKRSSEGPRESREERV